ncbi:hypothetical protein NQ315_008586 [Exocentrus adspersus]|uniref:SCP domain-containing protein n=1 Tax=Exocentrus adspersus TaxID=1586481 RepID=A0AAV8W728_9CUCU|nr:hypothetical protein NQ315_008586 [Exocentrus adspersus]
MLRDFDFIFFYPSDVGASCCHKEIIELHSRQRRILSPWMTRIPDMVWDNELAKKAQEIAATCQFKYEPPIREGLSGRFRTEQNMFLKCSKEDNVNPKWAAPIQDWFSVDKVRPNYATSSGETGQLPWRKLHSLLVGCGYANYKMNVTEFPDAEKTVRIDFSGPEKDYCQVYVCVYGPL